MGLRWRTEQEVVVGKGQFACGAKGCDERRALASYEVRGLLALQLKCNTYAPIVYIRFMAFVSQQRHSSGRVAGHSPSSVDRVLGSDFPSPLPHPQHPLHT